MNAMQIFQASTAAHLRHVGQELVGFSSNRALAATYDQHGTTFRLQHKQRTLKQFNLTVLVHFITTKEDSRINIFTFSARKILQFYPDGAILFFNRDTFSVVEVPFGWFGVVQQSDSNPGRRGEKHEHYLSAKPSSHGAKRSYFILNKSSCRH